MINIYLKHNPRLNCFDELIATIAKNEHKDYQLMLSNAWTFYFKENEESIGNSIQYSPRRDLGILKKIHGIEIIYQDNIDLRDLDCKYAGTFIDTFKCPWDKNYMKYHNYNHAIIINKFDSKNKMIHVVDPFYEKYEKLDYKSFMDACCGTYYFNIDDTYGHIDWISMLKYIMSLLRDTLQDISRISMLKEKVLYIDIGKEINKNSNIWHSAVVTNLNKISLDRLRYCIMLQYLFTKKNIPLNMCIKHLEEINSLWLIVRNLVIKYFLSKDYKYLNDAVKIIDILEDKEKSNCTTIINTINQYIEKSLELEE